MCNLFIYDQRLNHVYERTYKFSRGTTEEATDLLFGVVVRHEELSVTRHGIVRFALTSLGLP